MYPDSEIKDNSCSTFEFDDRVRIKYSTQKHWIRIKLIYAKIYNMFQVQDFTQAELGLLIHLCDDVNTMFFTGDTAQSIMRGVAFRLVLVLVVYGI